MNLAQLKDYDCWVGKSADKVYLAVRAVGGWKVVFPDKMPVWASKVRNYFNVFPLTLKRLPEREAKPYLNQPQNLGFLVECHEVQSANRKWQNPRPNPWGKLDPPPFKVSGACPAKASNEIMHTSWKESIALKSALTGDVYKDDRNLTWYQMAAGSTIYHWGDHPSRPTAEAIYQDVIMGQNDTPVFKLVCPDGTGGSREVIIFNAEIANGPYNNRGTVIGRENQPLNVSRAIETDPILQGSYNYSETTRAGLAAHEMRDVKAHVHDRTFYVNPTYMNTPLETRTFQELDNQKNRLADQK